MRLHGDIFQKAAFFNIFRKYEDRHTWNGRWSKGRIQKANGVFIQWYPAWIAREISIETKLKFF
jgi:hypothetical protein